MKIKDILKLTPEMQKEVFIGKEFIIEDRECLILGLNRYCEGDGEITSKLLALHEEDLGTDTDWDDTYRDFDDITVRQMLIEDLEGAGDSSSSDIKKFIVNGAEYDVLGANFYYLSPNDFSDTLLIKHFADHGCIPNRWQQKNVEELILAEHEMDEDIYNINWSADILKISAQLDKEDDRVLVGKVLECEQGEYFAPRKFSFKGKNGEVIEVKLFALKKITSKEAQEYLVLDEEEIHEIMEPDEQFLIVEYEASNGAEMQFYSKDYLDSYVDDASMDAWLGEGGALAGVSSHHGSKKFCVVDVVSCDFDAKVKLELLSYLEE